jgi:hypothetical protein
MNILVKKNECYYYVLTIALSKISFNVDDGIDFVGSNLRADRRLCAIVRKIVAALAIFMYEANSSSLKTKVEKNQKPYLPFFVFLCSIVQKKSKY